MAHDALHVLYPRGPLMPTPTQPLAVQRIDDVNRQPVRWLWPGWVARGTLTLLDGDPGMGKSTLAADLAAKVSRGTLQNQTPALNVLILSAEDDPARVIRPRLEAAGADLQRVLFVESIGVEERAVQLPDDLPRLG